MSEIASTTTVGIVIAQYGRAELTVRCIDSLRSAHPEVPLFVVDDGSPHVQDRRALQRRCSERVTLVALPENGGVTRAWNIGANTCLKQVAPEFLVFLNNDVITTGPWLESLLEPLVEGNALLTGPAWRTERLLPPSVLSTLPTTQVLEGWCLAMRTGTFLSLNGFDPAMTLYFSDTDLQCRLLATSEQALHAVLGLPLRHLGHQSTQTHPQRSRQWLRDRERFISKWSPR